MSVSFELTQLASHRAVLEKMSLACSSEEERKRVSDVMKELRDSDGNLAQTNSSFDILLEQLSDAVPVGSSNKISTPVDLFVSLVGESKNHKASEDDALGLLRFSAFFEDFRAKESSPSEAQDKPTGEKTLDLCADGVLASCDAILRAIAKRNTLISEYGELIAFGFRNLNDRAVYDQRVKLSSDSCLFAFLQRVIDGRRCGEGQKAKSEDGKLPRREPTSVALVSTPKIAEHPGVSTSASLRSRDVVCPSVAVPDKSNVQPPAPKVVSNVALEVKAVDDNAPLVDDVLSEYQRAWSYEMGLGKVRKNLNEACRWYQLAVDHGDMAARAGLRNLCACATVGFDFKAVAKWCRGLADSGDPWAQELLGWLYEEGRGLGKSKTHAIEWYKKAAMQKNDEAKRSLRRLQA